MKLVTAEQMRALDRRTIEQWGLPGMVLMENAGRAVVQVVAELLDEVGYGTVVVVAGKGNNGGDGFVVARWLHWAGVEVEVCLLPAGEELSGDAATNYRFAARAGVTIFEGADRDVLDARLDRAALIVDGVLGTGITGEVRGAAAAAIAAINAAPAPVVAIDIPSGVHADTGAILGDAVWAHTTVTFALPKVGLYQYPGRERCGRIVVAPIGMARALVEDDTLNTNLTLEHDAAWMLPGRSPEMHKGDAGRVLVIAGSVGMTGAAALAGLGAARAGAGLVYIACPRSLNDILEVKCTEVLTRPMPETDSRSLALAAQDELLAAASGVDAVVLGPGLSQHPETAELVRRLVARIEAPLVIDADGLNAFAGRVGELTARSAATVLTPHPGEMARLTGEPTGAIQADRLAAARSLAAQTGAVVVLKGAGTVTAAPDGEAWVNPTGNEGMASGGMGDVLAGMIGAFLAGGAAPLDAAVAGVFYHGRAADLAVEPGRRGLVASDLLKLLPTVFAPEWSGTGEV